MRQNLHLYSQGMRYESFRRISLMSIVSVKELAFLHWAPDSLEVYQAKGTQHGNEEQRQSQKARSILV